MAVTLEIIKHLGRVWTLGDVSDVSDVSDVGGAGIGEPISLRRSGSAARGVCVVCGAAC